jgi:acetyl esterase/lipase
MAMRAYEMCGTEIKERWPRLDVLIRSVVIVLLLGSTPAIAQKRLNDLYEPQVLNGMPVRVMDPDGFDADKQYPVIVSLHGDRRVKKPRRTQKAVKYGTYGSPESCISAA